MKKRLFAGALALLMIIGLLPVSSMLKKPVEAQAASTIKSYEVDGFSEDILSGNYIGDNQSDNFFKVGGSDLTSKTTYFEFSKTGEISFEIKGDSATINMEWSVAKNITNPAKKYVSVIDYTDQEVASSSNTTGKNKTNTLTYDFTKSGKYTIKNVGGTSIKISSLKVTVGAYTININDSKANETSKKVVVGEGENIPLEAAEDNFLYWETSHGRIASREPKPSTSLTAYYDETYTAVYGSDVTVYYMTAYNQIYKSVASDAFDSSSEQPAGPIRYGYKFTGWNMSASEIQAKIKSGTTKKIFVDPKYDQDTTTKYTVTVDTTALTGGKSVDTEYTINEVATASTSSAEFAYWKDAETGKVLSYNSTYYFFANKPMKVHAVKKSDDVTSEGVISLVYNGTDESGNSVVIFEYTVPSDCTVKFAGVYASPDKEKLTASAEFVGGDTFNSKETYKYTITKTKGMGTWYVKPVLEYTDSNGKSGYKTLDGIAF